MFQDILDNYSISCDNNEYSFPQITSIDSNNKVRIWNIYVIITDSSKKSVNVTENMYKDMKLNDYKGIYYTKQGQLNGKITSSDNTEVTVGKNIGKKNATNIISQTFKQVIAKYVKKNSNSELISPMLLTKKTLNFVSTLTEKLYFQPKINGVRMLAQLGSNNNIIFYSRSLHIIKKMETLSFQLTNIFDVYPKVILDGELFKQNTPLAEISGLVSKGNDTQLEYNIFDIYIPSQPMLTFAERYAIILKMQPIIAKLSNVNIVATSDNISTKQEIFDLYDKFMDQQYEGMVVRTCTGVYQPKKRSLSIIKIKDTCTDDFKIINFQSGKGKDENAIIWICETTAGKKFNVVPNMNLGNRKQMYIYFTKTIDKFNKYIVGQLLIVSYFELSVNNIPTQPKGISIRVDSPMYTDDVKQYLNDGNLTDI